MEPGGVAFGFRPLLSPSRRTGGPRSAQRPFGIVKAFVVVIVYSSLFAGTATDTATDRATETATDTATDTATGTGTGMESIY